MTETPSANPDRRPLLLCAGTDPAAAARLGEAAASLLADRPAVVLATWHSPSMSAMESVMDALYDADLELRVAARDAAAAAAAAATDALVAQGIEVSRRLTPEELPPWRVALEVADEIGAAIIVAGATEGPPAHPGALGSEARALAHRGRYPLLLVPAGRGAASPAAPVVFAYDGSTRALHALDVACELLQTRPALVTSAWETTSYAVGVALLAVPAGVAQTGADQLDEVSRTHADAIAQEARERLAGAGFTGEATALEARHNVATAMIEYADEHDAALIVTGTRGRSRIAAALLGSTAEALLRHSGRPVLLVPPPKDEG
jgi:nucleotide-binding universal stress UspA family protein